MTEDGKIERVSTKSPGVTTLDGRYRPAHGEQLFFKGQRIYAIKALGCGVCCVGGGEAGCSVVQKSKMSCSKRQFVNEVTWLKIQMRGEP